MKTRSLKLQHLLVLLAIFPLSTLNAQFDRFESNSNFNPASNGEPQPPISMDTLADDFDDDDDDDDFDDDDEEVLTPRANKRAEKISTGSMAPSSNSNPFGNRPQASGEMKTDAKYVKLNPETGYGPEIITSFDFPDTDILDLTKHMQKLTGINLIIDNDVKGKISISAPSAITVGDAWKAYLAALELRGFTVVKAGKFYKVISGRNARYSPTTIYTGAYTPDTESQVMKVITLKNVDAKQITRSFRPFMGRNGRILEIDQTNSIIVADTGANINRLERLIQFVDIPGHEETLQIIKVTNSSAQEIAKILDEILKGASSGSATSRRAGAPSSLNAPTSGGSSSQNISRIIAEPRTNSIIAMANAAGAKHLRELT
jgi:general secretion pathway protein D